MFMVVFAVLLLSRQCVTATPTIDNYNNSISNTNMFPVVSYGAGVTFNASADETITTWTWYVDDVDQSHNYDNLTASWSSSGYKNVNVTGTNANGTSAAILWNPYVQMDMAGGADTTSDMDDTGYDNLMLGLEGDNPDFEVFLWATTEPFQAVIGNMFFVILFGIPMIMFWIRQGTVLIPSMFGIIMGTVMFAFFPASFAATASAIILMSVLAVFYTMYKERK